MTSSKSIKDCMNDIRKMNTKVYIYTRPNLRDSNLEYEFFLERSVIEDCFDNMVMRDDVKSLHLTFPENYLNIIEQRKLYDRLQFYCPNLQDLTIKTHSVYIIQNTPADCCFICDKACDVPETIEDKDVDLKRKLYFEMTGNLFSDGLNIVSNNGIQNLS